MISDKKLCDDWLAHFPNLKRYKEGRKLLAKFECVVFGIELTKIYTKNYRPEFIAMNLLSSFLEFSVRRTLLKKKMQFDMPYLKHDKMLEEAITLMQEQAPSILNGHNTTEDIIQLYQEEIENIQSIGASPLAVWFSLIQTATYYGLDKIQNNEKKRMLEYVKALPAESLSIWGNFEQFIANELDVNKDELERRKIRNLSKLKL